MDDQEIRATLTEMVTHLDPEAEYELRDENDYVSDMPQSGERIRGRDNMRAMQRAYPDDQIPTFEVRRITGGGDVWILEAVGHYPGAVWHAVVIFEFRDGKIIRETRYFPQPFEAPDWRAEWVEPIQADADG